MGKKRVLFILLLMMSFSVSKACDACGCSISGGGIGLLSAYKNNFVGLHYAYSSFEAQASNPLQTKDQFHLSELIVRYYLNDRFKVIGQVPFRYNVRNQKEIETQTKSGLGDSKLMVSYSLFQNKNIGEQSRLFGEIGGGIKLPTGQYDPKIHDKNLPENFNPGNGSFAILVNPNFVWTRNKIGLVWSSTAELNFATQSGYQFGHQIGSQINFFVEKNLGKTWRIIPMIGIHAEYVTKDHYANRKIVEETGGQGIYSSFSLNLREDSFLLGLSYAVPIAGHYSAGSVQAKARFSGQISYFF